MCYFCDEKLFSSHKCKSTKQLYLFKLDDGSEMIELENDLQEIPQQLCLLEVKKQERGESKETREDGASKKDFLNGETCVISL